MACESGKTGRITCLVKRYVEQGQGQGDSRANEPKVSLDPFPLSVGSIWQYDVTYRGITATQAAVSITGTKTVDGTKVYVLGVGDIEYANYARTDSEILELPLPNANAQTRAIGPLVILKLPLRPGDKWVQVDKTVPYEDGTLSVYTEVTVREPEDVVTPAGYFKGAYPVSTNTIFTIPATTPGTGLISNYNKVEWIALGVGVVSRYSETRNPTVFAPGTTTLLSSYNIVKN
jgi:hypothetical protein